MKLELQAVATHFMGLGITHAREAAPGKNIPESVEYLSRCLSMKDRVLTRVSQSGNTADLGFGMPRFGRPLLSTLRYLHDHIDVVTPYIHDMWTAGTALSFTRFGDRTDKTQRTHALMKPIADFTPAELDQEQALARGDIGGFIDFLSRELDDDTSTVVVPGQLSLDELSGMIQLSCRLARHSPMIREAAQFIHANWVRVKTHGGFSVLDGDLRVGKTFRALSRSDREITENNVYNDWCAVIAFLLDLQES